MNVTLNTMCCEKHGVTKAAVIVPVPVLTLMKMMMLMMTGALTSDLESQGSLWDKIWSLCNAAHASTDQGNHKHNSYKNLASRNFLDAPYPHLSFQLFWKVILGPAIIYIMPPLLKIAIPSLDKIWTLPNDKNDNKTRPIAK